MAYVELLLTKGYTTLIDSTDAELVLQYNWHLSDTGYAVWRGTKDGKRQTMRLHRLVNNTPDGLHTDHINHNRLDNRRANLRSVTVSENMLNLTNQGKGYWYQKQNKNWVVELSGKHRGTFDTEHEAADFVRLVREGKADMKPKPEPTHCKYSHSLDNAYIINDKKRCRTCQSLRSAEYWKRKQERIGK